MCCCDTILFRFRDELRMNVNQHTPMASPYGQPQPGYSQPGYTPLDGGYPAQYPPYNGPASAYQPGVPPQGKQQLPDNFFTNDVLGNHKVDTLGCSTCLSIWEHVRKTLSLLILISAALSSLHLTSPITLYFCVCPFPSFSCISGYSPFTSFPSKAVAANPASDLSSPLDLGNWLCSSLLLAPFTLQISWNHSFCICRHFAAMLFYFCK